MKILYPEKISFKNEKGIKTFPDKQKLGEIVTIRQSHKAYITFK